MTKYKTISDWNTRLRPWLRRSWIARDDARTALDQAGQQHYAATGEPGSHVQKPQLTTDAYLRLLNEKLVSIGESGARGPGGVCVADLKQYAGVPARMILIAGLDDGIFSGNEDRPAWNPLARSQKTGDPSKRDSDRHALLLAVLGCHERLVLCYQGRSDEDAKERPPATALTDLLQAVDQTLQPTESPKIGARAHHQISFHHPLNGFSPSAFAANQNPSARGFFVRDVAAASALNEMSGLAPYAGLWTQILPSEPTPKLVSLRSLQDLIKEPTRLFLDRLGVRLPEKPEELPNGDLLRLNNQKRGLSRSTFARARRRSRSKISSINLTQRGDPEGH